MEAVQGQSVVVAPATWVPHGRPKEIPVYPLVRDARERLRELDDGPDVTKRGRPRVVDGEPPAKPVRVSSHRARVPRHTRAALPVGHAYNGAFTTTPRTAPRRPMLPRALSRIGYTADR